MPTKAVRSLPTQSQVSLPHSIHALLHTVRAIAHAEDELCTLLHAAEHAETIAPELSKELRSLLTRMPAKEYLDDLDTVRGALGLPARRRPLAAKQLSSKSRKAFRPKANATKSKAGARPKARKAKS